MALPLLALALKLLPFASAIPEVIRAFGGNKAADAADKVVSVAKAITGESEPEAAVEKVIQDPALQLEFQKALIAERITFRQMEIEETKVFVADTADARMRFHTDRGVFWLGILVLLTFALIVGLALFGSYALLMDEELKQVDPGITAAVFGFLGTIVGYVAANAQQVISYFFGSSRGSNEKSRDLADAVKKLSV